MSGSGSVEIRRRLSAPVAEVFRWWTEAELIQQWMTPVGTVTAAVDLRVGGTFRIVMAGEGSVIEHVGEFLEIDAPRHLVFTWASPFTGPRASIVTIELSDVGPDATELTLRHVELPAEAAASHRDGWGTMLSRLELAFGDRFKRSLIRGQGGEGGFNGRR